MSAIVETTQTFAEYFKVKMPSLAQILYEFPSGNVTMKLPSLSVSTRGDPAFVPFTPKIISQGPIVGNTAESTYVVGQYEIPLQVDIWARNKNERANLYEEFFNAFNRDIYPQGLRLQLTDFYAQWVSYAMLSYSFGDSEQSSQRQEWRVTIAIDATTQAIQKRTDYLITNPQLNFST